MIDTTTTAREVADGLFLSIFGVGWNNTPRHNAARDRTEAALTSYGAARYREGLEAAAKVVDDFAWNLPLYKGRRLNEATDDTAEMVREQAASAIRALAPAKEGE